MLGYEKLEFLFFLKVKKILFKVIKRSHPSIQEVYNRGPKQSNTKIRSIHQNHKLKKRTTSYDRHPIQ